MTRRTLVVFTVIAGMIAGTGSAPAARGQAVSSHTDGPTFRAATELIALNVVATDGHDRPVPGLAAGSFAVYEDGVKQVVSFFESTNVPLDLAILLDTSASMADKLATAQEAAAGFVSTLRDGDRVTVVDIKDGASILLRLSDDRSTAASAIRATSARGATALYNGVYMTLRELIRQRGADQFRRQAIAVLSDGADTASLVTFEDVMAEAKQAGIAIYTITLSESDPWLRQRQVPALARNEFAMKSLALETGGRAHFPTRIAQLTDVYGSIASELGTQYAIGYMSTNQKRDGSYRRVTVKVTEPAGVRSRTRAGYVAPRERRRAEAVTTATSLAP